MIVGRTLDSRLRGNKRPYKLLQPLFEIHLPSAFDYRGVPESPKNREDSSATSGVRLPMKSAFRFGISCYLERPWHRAIHSQQDAGDDMLTENLTISKLEQFALIGAAVLAVAIGDVLLKKAAVQGNLEDTLRSPWLWGAVALYLLQVVFFAVVFIAGWKLSHVGVLQAVLYTVVVLAAGVVFYRETVTPVQIVGIVFTVAGVVLINWQ